MYRRLAIHWSIYNRAIDITVLCTCTCGLYLIKLCVTKFGHYFIY